MLVDHLKELRQFPSKRFSPLLNEKNFLGRKATFYHWQTIAACRISFAWGEI
jgi:hypothetical protein